MRQTLLTFWSTLFLGGVIALPLHAQYQGNFFELQGSIDDTSAYPEISGTLWVKNPEGIDTNQVEIKEGDQVVNHRFTCGPDLAAGSEDGACVFILMEDHKKHEGTTTFFKEVLNNVVDRGYTQGHEVGFATFSLIGPAADDPTSRTYVYPENVVFSESTSPIKSALGMLPNPQGGAPAMEYYSHPQTYAAINQALDILHDHSTDRPKVLVVLHDGWAHESGDIEESDLWMKAESQNINVYSLEYYSGGRPKGNYDIEDLCKRSYGKFDRFHGESKSKRLERAEEALSTYLSEAAERGVGQTYCYTFTSEYGEDGSEHGFTVNVNKSDNTRVMRGSFQSPQPPEKSNLWLIVGGGSAMLVLLFIILLVIRRKNKQHKKQQAAMRESIEEEAAKRAALEELHERDKRAREAEQKAAAEKERKEQERKRQAEEVKRKEARDAVLIQAMGARGSFARLSFVAGNTAQHVDVNLPEFSLGRSSENHLVIKDQTVSGRHAVIRYQEEGGVYLIEDLNSSNGTKVNGRPVASCELSDGCSIELGGFVLTFQL